MLSSAVHHAAKTLKFIPALGRIASTALLQQRISPPHNTSIAGSLPRRRWIQTTTKWRPVQVLDEWVAKEARPISLRQLMVFGRSLTESRLLSSANYVRTELPTRIAHRIRDMQALPYVVVTNPHISEVYDLYYQAFDSFRRVKEIKTLEDNERLCQDIAQMLRAHLSVIPKLAIGVLQSADLMDKGELDRFMNTVLRSRISRRVIAEQHLALTETFNSDWFSPGAKLSESEFIGEVFLKCVAKDVVEQCGKAVQRLACTANGPDTNIPEIRVSGHMDANFPYILSHLQYIVGELLRNSVQAVIDKQKSTQQHVIIRFSDQGGGIPRDILPYLWSFSKGPQSTQRLENLTQVPMMAATLQELRVDGNFSGLQDGKIGQDSSLTSLSTRPPKLRLGMGLPLSRVYAEYWAGKLELHSLEGYGVDAFLQISKLGNKNEQLTTRATMDAV
ncbi:branched-chain alpha-ketoacid dehydrogenase [Pseudomassariella vexata]|uniref:Protein-serine/threonine kinase n=1 Tax=Pseudomassariella vexata TaxID=1141098 RepID=A0A1Y2EJD9_9PEZI|nr:branched-chain alpha-ketoacid dehydrogenase [Pseudomassariella vexata]ORY71587.1 branched-chain alpha-ketoacid dehydrogenase [Pseudomassariella vexata]